jgi:hypothetical protein
MSWIATRQTDKERSGREGQSRKEKKDHDQGKAEGGGGMYGR